MSTRPKTVAAFCPICGEEPREPHARGIDFEYGTTGDFEWTFRRCRNCEIVCLSPRPANEEISRIYPSNYYAYDFTKVPSIGYRVKSLLDRKSASMYRRYGIEGANILDVGCGDGRLLRILAESGCPVERLYGMDLDEEAVRRAQEAGFRVEKGRVEDAAYPSGFFGLIILQQVIEHVPDPRAVVAKLLALLVPGGAVVLETPNTSSWDHFLFRRRHWGGYHIPRHFFLFNRRSLPALLRDEGFDVLRVQCLASPSFWIQSVHHASRELGFPRVWLDLFRPHPPGFLPLAIFTALDWVGRALRATSNMRIIAVKR